MTSELCVRRQIIILIKEELSKGTVQTGSGTKVETEKLKSNFITDTEEDSNLSHQTEGGRDRHSLRVVVSHPFPQNDKSLVSSVDRQTVSVHQDPLMTFGEVQRPETPTDISI